MTSTDKYEGLFRKYLPSWRNVAREILCTGSKFQIQTLSHFLSYKIPPVVPQRVNRGEWEKEVVIYFW